MDKFNFEELNIRKHVVFEIKKDNGDNDEELESLEQKLKELLAKEKKVKKLEIKTPLTSKSLSESFDEFLDYKQSIEKVSVGSLNH